MQQISNNIFLREDIAKMELEDNTLPNPYLDYPFLVIENFLTEAEADLIAKVTKENSPKKAKVHGGLIKRIRNVESFKVDEISSNIYFKEFKKHQHSIEEFFSTPLLYGTDIQALGYRKGFFYKRHADNSSEIVDKNGDVVGYKLVSPERKITTVLFLNSHGESFSGGELTFNHLFDKRGENFSLFPKKGTMIVFPSNPIFAHEVKEVESGFRLTFVQWHMSI